MILLNVFALVAFAAAALLLMTAEQDAGLTLGLRAREQAEALAAARGGEASAIAALRRDMIEAPELDHYKERWAAVQQRATPIAHGTFSLSVEDAQSRFNINNLVGGGPLAAAALTRLVGTLKLPAGSAERIGALLHDAGPMQDLGELRRAGVDAATLAQIAPFVTALPGMTTVNVNTVSEPLLAQLIGDPVAARVLIDRRERPGFLTPADFAAARVSVGPGLGFTSDHYLVTTRVTVGQATQVLTTLLERRRGAGGVAVVPIARGRG